jgi:hypothetical protein
MSRTPAHTVREGAMKSAFNCYQEAAKCEQMAANALDVIVFLLDAARDWKQRGQEAAAAEAASLAADKSPK